MRDLGDIRAENTVERVCCSREFLTGQILSTSHEEDMSETFNLDQPTNILFILEYIPCRGGEMI